MDQRAPMFGVITRARLGRCPSSVSSRATSHRTDGRSNCMVSPSRVVEETPLSSRALSRANFSDAVSLMLQLCHVSPHFGRTEKCNALY